MLRAILTAGLILAPAIPAGAADTSGAPAASRPTLSAAQVVERNIAARGGLPAWRGVQTMTLEGKMGAGGNQRAALPLAAPGRRKGRMSGGDEADKAVVRRPTQEAELPFELDLARGRKSRLEIQFQGKTAIQVFDGTNGWKLRPFLNRNEVEAFSAEEKSLAATQADLDGYLIGHADKHIAVELESMERVDGRDNYRLKLVPAQGRPFHVWVDAQTFLESKIEGQPRKLDGVDHQVEVAYKDYRAVGNLKFPFVLETRVLPVARTVLGLRDPPVPIERISVERVLLNPRLDDARFAMPRLALAGTVASAAVGR